MAERGGFENHCTFTGTQGSNPCLSAISFYGVASCDGERRAQVRAPGGNLGQSVPEVSLFLFRTLLRAVVARGHDFRQTRGSGGGIARRLEFSGGGGCCTRDAVALCARGYCICPRPGQQSVSLGPRSNRNRTPGALADRDSPT